MVLRRLHTLSKRAGLTRTKPPHKRLHQNSQLILTYAIAVLVIAYAYTIPVLKVPGKYVGAGIIHPGHSYELFAAKAMDMGLDFVVVQTNNPEIISLCYMDEEKYGLKCIITPDGSVKGHELRECNTALKDCEALNITGPHDIERAVMSCDSIVSNCSLRPFPLWHRVLIKYGVLAYVLIALLSLKPEKELEYQISKVWRHITK